MNDLTALTESLASDLASAGVRQTNGAFVLSGNRAIAWRWPEGTEPGHAEVGPAARAIRVVAELDGKLAKIDGDVMASDLAKQQRRDATIEAARLDLQVIENGADLDDRTLGDLERQHVAIERPRDPVEQLADMEVRTWFRGLDAKERAQVLQDAGPELLLALVRSPIPPPPGTGEVVAANWRALRDKAHPERASAIEGRKARLQTLRTVIDHARRAIPSSPTATPTVRRVA